MIFERQWKSFQPQAVSKNRAKSRKLKQKAKRALDYARSLS
jgi:hypothetical protein